MMRSLPGDSSARPDHRGRTMAEDRQDLSRRPSCKYGTRLPELGRGVEKERTAGSRAQGQDGEAAQGGGGAEDIAEVVSRLDRHPRLERCWRGRAKLIQMEERLSASGWSGRTRRSRRWPTLVMRSGTRGHFQDPNRPMGSFIFMGPTGVGKTELARSMAEFLFDDEHATWCAST